MTTFTPRLRAPHAVLADVVAPRLSPAVRSAALVAGGAGFVGLCAQLSVRVPGTPVPVTAQTFAVLLVGAVLGWRDAALSLVLYAVVGGLGVPWFAHGGSGWGGVTFGYVLGFVLAATVVGYLAGRGADRSPLRTAATMALGTALIYAIGVPWLAHAAHVSLAHAWALGARPFFVGDALKVLLAAGLLPSAWMLLRRR